MVNSIMVNSGSRVRKLAKMSENLLKNYVFSAPKIRLNMFADLILTIGAQRGVRIMSVNSER
jgi:hypothetical protein